MNRFILILAVLSAMSGCAVVVKQPASGSSNPDISAYDVLRIYSTQDMKSAITPHGITRIPEDANAGQKLYLNPAHDLMMLCAVVDEVTDTCLRFYRN
jgi:uncharacterized protein YceK